MSATIRSPRFLPSPSSLSGSDSEYRADQPQFFSAPRSPVSPSYMSVATKSYVSAYGNNQHTDEMAQRPPRTQAENLTPSNQRTSSFQEGSLKRPNPDDDGPHREKRQKIETPQSDGMDIDNTATPTNHDRKEDAGESTRPIAPDLTVTDEFAEPFLLCKSSVSRSYPDPQQHLLATCGLLPLLKTVARNDPETGEKINKLRKSYEGQIKMFGLSGRNKPVKCEREEEEPGPLRALVSIAEQEWDEGPGRNKIEATADFRAKLDKAMQLQPGTVRNNAMWEDLLGHEKPKVSAAPTPIPPQQMPRIPNGIARPPPGVGVDKRFTRGKKRSYGDDSFVGYGEGFSEGDDDGDDDEIARRKRKKDAFGAPSTFQHNR